MRGIVSSIRSNGLLCYFILAIHISWMSALLVTGFRVPLTVEEAATVGPLMYIAMLTGPFISGLILTYFTEKKIGLKQLWERFTDWKVSPHWYVFALLVTPMIAFIVLMLLSLFSPIFTPTVLVTENKLSLLMQGVFTGLFVGIFEEIGWTGFAVPQMRKRGKSILTTGILVGLVWGLWHFIPFWEDISFSDLNSFTLLIARLFSWLIPFRILMVWLYDRTQSLFLTILMHSSAVFSTLVLPSMQLAGTELLVWILSWTAALWGLVGVIYWKKLIG